MTRSQRTSTSGFTLIETLFATVMFGILISATFAVLRYIGQTTQESRDAIKISQQLENNLTILHGLARQTGWETFLANYFPGKKYVLTTSSPFLADASALPAIAEGEWRVTLSADPDLGPYITNVAVNATASPPTYTLTFSSPVYAKVKDPNQLIPIITSGAVKWLDDSTNFATVPASASATVTVTSSAGQIASLTGQRLKPTGNVVDQEERSDITSQTGMILPASGSSAGYPSVVKVRFETVIGGTTLSYTTSLSAEP